MAEGAGFELPVPISEPPDVAHGFQLYLQAGSFNPVWSFQTDLLRVNLVGSRAQPDREINRG
jgi:hypothetical protein